MDTITEEQFNTIKANNDKYQKRRELERQRNNKNYHEQNDKWRAYFRERTHKQNAILFIKNLFVEEPVIPPVRRPRGRPKKKLNLKEYK